MALESDYAGKVGSYAFKACLLLLASPKYNTTFHDQNHQKDYAYCPALLANVIPV